MIGLLNWRRNAASVGVSSHRSLSFGCPRNTRAAASECDNLPSEETSRWKISGAETLLKGGVFFFIYARK